MALVQFAGVLALVALAVVIASLLYLHLAPTGLSPVRNAVSQYGITPYRVGYRVATIAFGIAGVALAYGLHRQLGGSTRSVVAALVVFAVARATISWFPMDAPGAQPTPDGRTHRLLAFATFLAVTYAAGKLADVLSHGTRWHGLAGVSSALAIAMGVCLVTMLLRGSAPVLRERFGAIERGFYVSAIAWFAVFASACATSPR